MTDKTVQDLGEAEFARRMANSGVGLRLGPFNAQIQVAVDGISDTLYRYYESFPLLGDGEIYSFRVRIESRRRLTRLHKPVVRFTVDGLVPHEDLPIEQAVPVLEWGMNLVIALRSHAYLMLHTAVVEKHGAALLLPAAPGFGKTTLCAALVHRGWRLLSDEFGLVRPGQTDFVPVPRPMALKNESIEIIKEFATAAVVGPAVSGTRKGTVAHVAPPPASVAEQQRVAPAQWIVFPRWVADAPLSLDELKPSDGFMKIAMNAFNYELLGESGFNTIRNIVESSSCYRLEYSNLDEAVSALDALADRAR